MGIFVFLGLAIFIITVLTLGSQKKTFGDFVKVKTFFENVNGLQKGNNVWFSGVKVGTIQNVNLIGDGKVEVDMYIEEKSAQFIRKDARAKLSTDGLIGNKIIEIYGGASQSPQISNGDLIVGDTLLSTDAMMKTLSKNNDNLLAITTDFKMISNRITEGKGTLGRLLTSDELSNNLNSVVLTVRNASQHLERLTANVADYTSRLNDKGTLASDLVTDTIVFSKLRTTVSQLQEVAGKSKEVINNLQMAGNTLNEGLQNKNSPAGMFLGDEKTASGLKATLQNLQSASKKLDEDLEALQHNFLLRGFFRKKAKKESREKEETRVVLDTTLGR